ncbi:unnamed protein product [Effrenium voratum]|nr:unnamed protein product [Effrenium voratum]
MAQTADFHADWHLIRANSSLMPHKFTLTDMDKKIRLAKYAVRGAVPARAAQLSAKLKEGKETLPFERMVFCNIGNPHAVQQKPITFFRQVAASVTEPGLLKAGIYSEDVVKRATEYLGATNGAGTGAYTDSSGLLLVRQQVAEFLLKRDGFPAEPKNIYLTTGASEGVKRAISALIKDERCGMLIPRPQYPLYSAALTMTGGRIVYYDMFEEKGWKTSFEELNQAATDAFTDGTKLRAGRGRLTCSRRLLVCLFVLFCFVCFVVLLCYVMLCFVCFVLFCFVLFCLFCCFVLLCYGLFVLFCFVLFCFVCFVVLFCYVMVCLFCFVLFCFVCFVVLLCYVMFCLFG